jgi:hypothetical protein
MLDLNNGWNLIDTENEEKIKGNIVFKRPIKHEYCPLFCNTCKNVISSIEDVDMMKKENVCELCYITYYFVNKEKWDRGWRPNKKNCQ